MLLEKKGNSLFKNFELWIKKEPLRLFIICLFIILWVGVLYINTLKNQFTNWDDSMIYSNSQVRSLSWDNIKKIFTHREGETYQPIRVLSYAIDYFFWRLNPVGYHITNIIFYILTCITVFFTIHHLSSHLRERASNDSHERVALFGSLIFAAHPVHVEAVTWLAARKEVLQGFFFFSAFYLYLKGREDLGWRKVAYFGFVLFSILLAVLSKPSAVVFPAVLLIYEVAHRKDQWINFFKKNWIFFSISILISMIFTFILIRVMLEAGGVKPYHGGTFFNNLLISFYALFYNMKLLLYPAYYSAAYTIGISNPILSLQTFLFVGITFLLFGLSLWSLKKMRIIFFSFFFFFVSLLPYLNILPISTLLADRYLFIASFSYCSLLGVGFDKLYEYKNKKFSENYFKVLSIAIFLSILMGYSFITIQQNKVWENSYTLWSDAVEKYPESNTANALMGVVYMEIGMNEKAVDYLEKAVRILPYDYQSRNNLGIVYAKLNQPEKALNEYLIAIWLKPEDDTIKINLSYFYMMQKEYKKAEGILKNLISKNPNNSLLYFRLAMVYKEIGQYEAALAELEKSLPFTSLAINHYEEMGNIYSSRLRDAEKAKYYYLKGIEAEPRAKSRVEQLRWMIQDLECHR